MTTPPWSTAPPGRRILRPVVVRGGVHGDLRDQTHRHLHPLALGRRRRRASAAQWAALIARDRGCIRCGRSPRHCHAHHIIHWKDGGRTDLSNLAFSVRDVITTCTTAGTPSPWTPTPSPSSPTPEDPLKQRAARAPGYKRSESVSGLRGRWDVLDLHQFRRPRLPRRKWGGDRS